MKKSLVRSRLAKLASFTLVELLVVMGIIAILAGVLLGTFNNVITKAKQAKMQNLATQIQTAALGYYTEYSIYPVPSGSTGDVLITDGNVMTDTGGTTPANPWGSLIDALCGNISVSNPTGTAVTGIANTRAIAFLSLKVSDVSSVAPIDAPTNILAPSSANPYFNIALNSSYTGVLGTTTPTSGASGMPNFTGGTPSYSPNGTSTAGVAVWANCNNTVTTTRNASSSWVHTY